MAEANTPRPRIAIIPSPGLGHLIPLVELAKRLVDHHCFAVTFIIPRESSPSKAERSVLNSLSSSSISSVFLPPADLSDVPSTAQIETRISLTVTRSNPALRELFRLFSAEKCLPAVLLVDLFGTDAFDVAVEFHVAPYIFYPSNANVLSFILHLPKLDETVSCPFQDLTEPVKLPGCVPISGKDLVDPTQDRNDDAYKWLLHNAKRFREAKGILLNSFVELEPNAIKALQEPGSDRPQVYPIGPLVIMGLSDAKLIDDSSKCLNWLDEQPLGSVLYVSFGSGGTLTLEQKTNTLLLVAEVGAALRAQIGEDGIVRKEEVVRVVNGLMEGEEGRAIRNKMKELKEGVLRVLREDGFSTKALGEVSLKWKAHQQKR